MARSKKMKLFITFINFSKAYDLVRRQKLFTMLRSIGCGPVMLAVLKAIYRVTESLVGGAVFNINTWSQAGVASVLFLIHSIYQ